MLEDAEEKGFDDIVSWNKDGDGFTVHNKDRFTKEIVPIYFNQTRYKSFQRQLSLYGFERSTTGSNKGLRHHEKLRRGFKHLCRQMKPVGYKPRGQEKAKDKRESDSTCGTATECNGSHASTSSTSMNLPLPGQGIPTVISSESIYKENPITPPTLPSEGMVNPLSTTNNARSGVHEITERLITTDYIAIFEGMPFYLMTTIPSEVQNDASSSANVPPTTSNQYGVEDGQMQKAWEIGFAVARTMTDQPVSFAPTPEISVTETISYQTLQ
jgi:hypothetical protein